MSLNVKNYLSTFKLDNQNNLFKKEKTKIQTAKINGIVVTKYINEYWTARQRQSNCIHEISYRACFKAELPRFFIELFSKKNDIIYDPFAGRGTTLIEAALNQRNFICNDINPLSKIFIEPRLNIPNIKNLEERLCSIKIDSKLKSDIDLSMFFHKKTLQEILSIKNYLYKKKKQNKEDIIDKWIRLLATNRLTGHSKGFFSVYTLPPNQATNPKRQKKINLKRNQKPEYRDTKKLILKKSHSLLKDLDTITKKNLRKILLNGVFLKKNAANTNEIKNNYVQLTVTSPPFLDTVDYISDNWLRFWFNNIDPNKLSKKVSIIKSLDDWCLLIKKVFIELFRITKKNGYVAFEVGEIRNKKINLDEYVANIGIESGFECEGILLNQQNFTKTSNIWGINNNKSGTNSNRVVIFKK